MINGENYTLISVLPNMDNTIFAVFGDEEYQYKKPVVFWAFYNDTEKEGFPDFINNPVVQYADAIGEFCLAHDEPDKFLGLVGGNYGDIEIDKSEFLPVYKRKIKNTTPEKP